MISSTEKVGSYISPRLAGIVCAILMVLTCPFNIFSETPASQARPDSTLHTNRPVRPVKPRRPVRPSARPEIPEAYVLPDSIDINYADPLPDFVTLDSISTAADTLAVFPIDSIPIVQGPASASANMPLKEPRVFNPDPTRAVWMSALFPGLGQLYNRRYWKLPIVIGAFMGLGYATSWNSTMLSDYTTAYSDIMDNDPNTKSYMGFFAPTVKEENLDKSWLTNLLRTRKNYYRRNRDLCILCMVGVYLVAMVDAYVDAQLAHFDISPDLSVDVAPALMDGGIRNTTSKPSIGLYWAINF